MWCAFGFTAAAIIQLPLLVLGVAAIIKTSPLTYTLLCYAGAGYLIYLGWQMLRRSQKKANIVVTPQITPLAALRQGMLVNLFNPQVLIFMLAFLPQFIDPSRGSVAMQILILAITMKFCGLLVNGSVALVSGFISSWIARRAGLLLWQERVVGGLLIALGLHLLFHIKEPS